MEHAEILILGAGLAGLALGQRLRASPHFREGAGRVVLLDKGRRPGGRCASRRVGEEVVDYGPVFGHGEGPEILELARAASPEGVRIGWPSVVSGQGIACSAHAFVKGAQRFAIAEGMNQLAAHLAEGLDVRTEVHVEALEPSEGRWIVRSSRGPFSARVVVVTFPGPQTSALLAPITSSTVRSFRALLELVPVVPCLTLIAQFPLEAPEPGFELCLPEGSRALQMIANDSVKRVDPKTRSLVLQARPAWSATHLEDTLESWSAELLEAARPFCPTLAAAPLRTHAHRWRFARLAAPGLGAPLFTEISGGLRLGLAGEAFDPAGGLEGALRSGARLAELILTEVQTA